MDNPVPETPTQPITPALEKPADFLPKDQPQSGFPQPPAPVAPPAEPTLPTPATDHTGILPGNEKPKSKTNMLMVVAIILLLVAIGTLGFFVFQNIQKRQTPAEPTPTPITTPTPTPDPTAGWEKYTNEQYGFELRYPSAYKQTEDKYGWPKSILLLYKGGQSYDLAVEIWNSELEYQTKYKTQLDTLIVKQNLDKFITLLNQNKDPEVDQIISTFKLISPTPTETMPTSSPSATPTVTP